MRVVRARKGHGCQKCGKGIKKGHLYAILEGKNRRGRRSWVKRLCEDCGRKMVGDDGFEARIRRRRIRGS